MSTEQVSTDDYHKAVGQLVHNAAVSDTLLFCTFQLFLDREWPIARAIYYTSDALGTRKQMVSRLLEAANGDTEDKAIVAEIFSAADVTHKNRNELAHSLIMDPPTHGGPSVRVNPKALKQVKRPVTRAYLGSLLNPSGEAARKAVEAYYRLCKKHSKPPQVRLDLGTSTPKTSTGDQQ